MVGYAANKVLERHLMILRDIGGIATFFLNIYIGEMSVGECMVQGVGFEQGVELVQALYKERSLVGEQIYINIPSVCVVIDLPGRDTLNLRHLNHMNLRHQYVIS